MLLYASGAPTGTLAPYLNLTVDIGADTPDAFGNGTSFVSVLDALHRDAVELRADRAGYASGLATWDPSTTGPDTRTFRFRLAVQDNPDAEGMTSTFGFSRETRTS